MWSMCSQVRQDSNKGGTPRELSSSSFCLKKSMATLRVSHQFLLVQKTFATKPTSEQGDFNKRISGGARTRMERLPQERHRERQEGDDTHITETQIYEADDTCIRDTNIHMTARSRQTCMQHIGRRDNEVVPHQFSYV